MKKVILGIIVVVLLAGIGWYVTKNREPEISLSLKDKFPPAAESMKHATLDLTGDGVDEEVVLAVYEKGIQGLKPVVLKVFKNNGAGYDTIYSESTNSANTSFYLTATTKDSAPVVTIKTNAGESVVRFNKDVNQVSRTGGSL